MDVGQGFGLQGSVSLVSVMSFLSPPVRYISLLKLILLKFA